MEAKPTKSSSIKSDPSFFSPMGVQKRIDLMRASIPLLEVFLPIMIGVFLVAL